jgi:phosphoenolpyruvate carboxykinase (GTP)
VLAWVFRRCDVEAGARETPIGMIPAPEDLDLTGLKLDPTALNDVLEVDNEAVRAELLQVREWLTKFGERLPEDFRRQLASVEQRLSARPYKPA